MVKSDDYLIFPGGGTQFKEGVMHYIEFIEEVPDFFVSWKILSLLLSHSRLMLLSRLTRRWRGGGARELFSMWDAALRALEGICWTKA